MHNTINSLKKHAIRLYHADKLPESCAAFTQLCAQTPTDAESWGMLGIIKSQLGSAHEAERCLKRSLELDPGSGQLWTNLGTLLQHLGRLEESATCLQRALAINPKDAIAHNNLGVLLREQGKLAEAMDCYRTAIRLTPRYAQAHNNLGTLLHEQCKATAAIDSYRKALKAEPRFAQAHYNLGITLQSIGAHESALYHYEKALQLAPGMLDAVAAIAQIQEKEGRFEAAQQRLEPFLGSAVSVPIALAYATLSRRTGRQTDAATMLERLLAQGNPAPIQRQELEFALGDLYDDLGDHDTAFGHYRSANTLRPYRFDPEALHAHIRAIVTQVDRTGLDRLRSAGPISERPVFIIGMPRSGTSLIEQILASHPEVHGGGELPFLGDLVNELQTRLQAPYPQFMTGLSAGQAGELSRNYLKHLDGISKSARLITDKLPHNFLYLGLIHAALPGAKIIHCTRNPMDTCLSIYFHNFNSNHPYATDLASLGHYYRAYAALMEHWRGLLGTQLLEVSYEDLIQNQEEATRKLLIHCNLEWNEACLRFHKTKRIVNTPSYDQVRKPIYRSSIGRWRNYEKHLIPLKEALGPLIL